MMPQQLLLLPLLLRLLLLPLLLARRIARVAPLCRPLLCTHYGRILPHPSLASVEKANSRHVLTLPLPAGCS